MISRWIDVKYCFKKQNTERWEKSKIKIESKIEKGPKFKIRKMMEQNKIKLLKDIITKKKVKKFMGYK